MILIVGPSLLFVIKVFSCGNNAVVSRYFVWRTGLYTLCILVWSAIHCSQWFIKYSFLLKWTCTFLDTIVLQWHIRPLLTAPVMLLLGDILGGQRLLNNSRDILIAGIDFVKCKRKL